MSENLATILTDTAAEHGDRTAFKLDDVELSYSMLDGASTHLSGLLKARGLEPGDRVGLMLPNVPYFPAIYYGILRAGGIVVPMNVLLKGREVKFYLEDSGAKFLFAWHDFAEAAEKGADEAGAEPILVKPGEFEEMVGSKALGAFKPDDVLLGALPLFHSFGQTCTMNCGVLIGACVTMLPRFDPEKALEIIDRDRVTVFQGVPTMYNAMLHAEKADSVDASCLRICNSGGAAIPVELIRGFEDKFGCAILEGYGLSETSPVASFNHPDRERKPGSIGTPIEGVEMQVWSDDGKELPQGEVGEIVIRGHNVMKGYWNRPEATAEAIDADGWFRTGDMARVDEDGYFFIVDRKKDLVIRGGFNIYPREIEEVLYEHP